MICGLECVLYFADRKKGEKIVAHPPNLSPIYRHVAPKYSVLGSRTNRVERGCGRSGRDVTLSAKVSSLYVVCGAPCAPAGRCHLRRTLLSPPVVSELLQRWETTSAVTKTVVVLLSIFGSFSLTTSRTSKSKRELRSCLKIMDFRCLGHQVLVYLNDEITSVPVL